MGETFSTHWKAKRTACLKDEDCTNVHIEEIYWGRCWRTWPARTNLRPEPHWTHLRWLFMSMGFKMTYSTSFISVVFRCSLLAICSPIHTFTTLCLSEHYDTVIMFVSKQEKSRLFDGEVNMNKMQLNHNQRHFPFSSTQKHL